MNMDIPPKNPINSIKKRPSDTANPIINLKWTGGKTVVGLYNKGFLGIKVCVNSKKYLIPTYKLHIQ